MEKEFLTLQEAAQFLGRSERALYHMVSRRAIPYSRQGTRLVFSRRALQAWMESMSVVSVDEALSRASAGR